MHPNRCNFFNPIFSKFIYFEISLKFELVSEMTSAFLWLLQPKINHKWSKKGKELPKYWQESDDKQKTKLEFKSKSKVRVTAWKVWLHIYKHKWTSFVNSQAGGMATWSWTALKSIFRETMFLDHWSINCMIFRFRVEVIFTLIFGIKWPCELRAIPLELSVSL